MKKYSLVMIIAIFLALLSSALFSGQIQAQIDALTFFIPYPADLLDNQYSIGKNNDPAFLDANVVTTISIAIGRNNTLIYYDHWEDGLEANLTSPTQATSEVWGDGDPTNGAAPGVPGDILTTGTPITIQSIIPLPRDPNVIIYDGGDKLTAVAGNIAVSVANWIENPGGVFYAGAWELYPTGNWGVDYVAPIGENLGGVRAGFSVVLVNVQAAQDGTTVQLDLDADNIPDGPPETLDEGEQFTQITGTTNSGGRIQASGPVQVHLFTSDPATNFEARAYTLIPVSQWTDDYVAPRSSAGDFWLYNPDPTNAITVIARTSIAPDLPLNIPPNTTVKYPLGAGAFSPATGVNFSSNGPPFYGVAALDPGGARDWGYSLLPVANLTTQKLVGWAPGNNNTPPGPGGGGNGFESRLYATALTTTTIRADFNNDGTPDQDFPITPLVEVPLTDPDFDLTGAFLYTEDGTPFVAVWGQDQTANTGLPSIDIGTAVVPLPALALQKTLNLVNDADGSGAPTWGDTVRFEIFVANNSRAVLDPTTISDNLPAETTYVPNSTTIGGAFIPDDGVGATTFPLDEGGVDVTLGPLAEITATFDVIINPGVDNVANTATASAPGVPPVSGSVGVPIKVADYQLDKRLISPADGLANRGSVITYGITITSTGNISVTKLPLRDVVNPDQLTFLTATPPPDIVTTGVITWTDLATTSLFGPLEPNRVIVLTTTYRINNVPADVTSLTNTATVEGAQGADGSPLPAKSDQATVQVPPLIAAYEFSKRLIAPADGQSASGETVTFGLVITSTGNLTITKLTLRDTFDENHLTFQSSTPPPSSNQPGVTIWDNLIDTFGLLSPGKIFNVTVIYTVDPLPSGVANTINTATVDGVEDSLGNSLNPQTAMAEVIFPPAPPTPFPEDEEEDDDDEALPPTPSPTTTPESTASAFASPEPTPSPTTTPESAAGAFAPPEPTPSLPVALLPETGEIGKFSGSVKMMTLLLLATGILAGLILVKIKGEV